MMSREGEMSSENFAKARSVEEAQTFVSAMTRRMHTAILDINNGDRTHVGLETGIAAFLTVGVTARRYEDQPRVLAVIKGNRDLGHYMDQWGNMLRKGIARSDPDILNAIERFADPKANPEVSSSEMLRRKVVTEMVINDCTPQTARLRVAVGATLGGPAYVVENADQGHILNVLANYQNEFGLQENSATNDTTTASEKGRTASRSPKERWQS